jgi:hypothetical protein
MAMLLLLYQWSNPRDITLVTQFLRFDLNSNKALMNCQHFTFLFCSFFCFLLSILSLSKGIILVYLTCLIRLCATHTAAMLLRPSNPGQKIPSTLHRSSTCSPLRAADDPNGRRRVLLGTRSCNRTTATTSLMAATRLSMVPQRHPPPSWRASTVNVSTSRAWRRQARMVTNTIMLVLWWLTWRWVILF